MATVQQYMVLVIYVCDRETDRTTCYDRLRPVRRLATTNRTIKSGYPRLGTIGRSQPRPVTRLPMIDRPMDLLKSLMVAGPIVRCLPLVFWAIVA